MTLEAPVWSLSGNQGDRWKQAKVSIHPTSSFQVRQKSNQPCEHLLCPLSESLSINYLFSADAEGTREEVLYFAYRGILCSCIEIISERFIC